MSLNLSKHERKELQATNIGLQLLFDNRQTRSSATIFLQWCVAKPIADYFRDNKIRDAMLLIEVKRPDGNEVRHLFALTSENEVMQFHAPGTHTIKACIVWGVKLKAMRNALLGKRTGRNITFSQFLGEYSVKRRQAIGLKRFGQAELSIEVPAEFFAPQLSARETWWINLMFPGMAQNSCSIRRRRMLAYTLQPPIIGIWVVMIALWRTFLAFFFGVLLAIRVDLEPIFHPFTQSFADIAIDKDNNTSWLLKRTDGTERAWGESALLFTPLIHVVLSVIALWILAGNDFKLTGTNFGIVYVSVIVAIVLVVLALAGINAIFSNFRSWWEKGWDRLAAWLVPDKWDRLLCSTTPAQGLRPIGYTPRLLYHRVVGAYCKPVAT